MSSSDDLRSRIEAQVAARRHKAKGRHARVHTAEPGHHTAQPGHHTAQPGHHTAPRTASPVAATQIISVVRPDQDDVRTQPPPPPPHRKGQTRFGFTFRLVVLIAVAGMLAVTLRTFVVEPFWIPSESMERTLHGCTGCNDDRLLVDKLSYKLHDVHRGDVVVFHRPPGVDAAEKVLIKRVIGMPGESVSGHGGRVWIGNRMLQESYLNPGCDGTQDFAAIKVPPGDVFVMGDNRCDSTDSRVFGPIKKSTIIGRAFIIIWPLGRIHWL